MFKFELPEPDFGDTFQALELDATTKASLLLQLVGEQVVAYLRSLTDEMRPPATRGSGARRAHPGRWADVTGALALAYAYKVEAIDGGAMLVLSNHLDYAAALEAKDGYFVLSGVADPGGPVEAAIREVVALAAPEWEVYAV